MASFFQSLKQNFMAYRSSKVHSRPDCIFAIHQLWQSGFSRVYSNCCRSCSIKREIIKIGQSSYQMCSNNMLNFQEPTPILDASTKKSGNILKAPRNLLMSLPLLLQQCIACLVRLIWIVFVMGGRCPYSCCFVGCCLLDLLRASLYNCIKLILNTLN